MRSDKIANLEIDNLGDTVAHALVGHETDPSDKTFVVSSRDVEGSDQPVTRLAQERIPPELLAEIFALDVDGLPVCVPPRFSDPHWVLARVCRRWRSTALEERRLWNSFEVTSTRDYSPLVMIRFANKMLPPSGLLSLVVNDHDDSPSFSESTMDLLIIPLLPRLKVLDMSLLAAGYSRFFQQPADLFIALQKLNLHLPCYGIGETILQVVRTSVIFNAAKSLRDLTITSSVSAVFTARLACMVLDLPIPWHQLHALDLKLGFLRVQSVYSILRRCTAIRTFNTLIHAPNTWEDTEDLVLPNLTHLSVWLSPVDLYHAFRPLILPALTEIHLNGSLYVPSDLYATLSRSTTRHDYTFSVFNASADGPEDTAALENFMSLIPSVRVFKGRGLFLTASTLGLIGNGKLLPRAEILSCDIDSPTAFVNALEMRLAVANGTSSVTAFRVASAECPQWPCSEATMEEVNIRLKGLGPFSYEVG